jgi:putative membrane protein
MAVAARLRAGPVGIMDGGGGMWDMGGMGGMMMWMLFWGVVGISLLVLAVIAVVSLVRRRDAGPSQEWRPDSPQQILARRYAAGEIEEEEFLRRRSNLEH